MSSIVYSPLAKLDLEDIWDHIEGATGSSSIAKRTVVSIIDRVSLLSAFPRSGVPLSSICNIETEYRYVNSEGYLAFYRLRGQMVYVDRILSAKSDYLAKLFRLDSSDSSYN